MSFDPTLDVALISAIGDLFVGDFFVGGFFAAAMPRAAERIAIESFIVIVREVVYEDIVMNS